MRIVQVQQQDGSVFDRHWRPLLLAAISYEHQQQNEYKSEQDNTITRQTQWTTQL